jgi:hypothetical protein
MPITKEQADGEIHAFNNEFPGLSGLKIIHRPTQEHFYGAKGSVEALGFAIKGAFLPRQGHIHLALANFHNEGDLRKSLKHEALGHFGTLTFTGSEKRDLLEVIIAARRSPSMKGDWARVDKAYAGQSELMKAEEVFCLAAERIDGTPSKTADQAVRTWSDVVQNKTRPLEREDLQTIVESVADGIRRGTRGQQIFPSDDRSQFGASDQVEAEALAVEAEQQERDQSAEVDRDVVHSPATYENELQTHIEAKQQQVERIESRLETLIEQQEARLLQTQQNKPGVLAMPSTRSAWRERQEEQRSRLKGLHARLERVQSLREGMSTHGPKLEELATRKLRTQNPELAAGWDESQAQARREHLEQRQAKKKGQQQAQGRSQTLGLAKPE